MEVSVVKQIVIGILRQNNQVLLSTRQAFQSHAGALEFPGGQVEEGETLEMALCREFKEEVGIETEQWAFMMRVPWVYGEQKIVLNVFQTTRFKGLPTGCEGQKVAWYEIKTLQSTDFPEANASIIQTLQGIQS